MLDRFFVSFLIVAGTMTPLAGMEIITTRYKSYILNEIVPLVDLAAEVLLGNSSEKDDAPESLKENFKEMQRLFSGDHFDRFSRAARFLKDQKIDLAFETRFNALILGHFNLIDSDEKLTNEEKELTKINFATCIRKDGIYFANPQNSRVISSYIHGKGSYRYRAHQEQGAIMRKIRRACSTNKPNEIDTLLASTLFGSSLFYGDIFYDLLLSGPNYQTGIWGVKRVSLILSALHKHHPESFKAVARKKFFLHTQVEQRIIAEFDSKPKESSEFFGKLCEWGCRLDELDKYGRSIVQVCVLSRLNFLEVLLENIEKHMPKKEKLILLNYKAPFKGHYDDFLRECNGKTALAGLTSLTKINAINLLGLGVALHPFIDQLLDHGAYDEDALADLRWIIKNKDQANDHVFASRVLEQLEENFKNDGKEVPL